MKNAQPPPLCEHLQCKNVRVDQLVKLTSAIELKRNVLGSSSICCCFLQSGVLKKVKTNIRNSTCLNDELPSKEACNGGVACSHLDSG